MTFSKRRRIYLMRHGSVTYFDGDGKPFLPEMVPLNPLGQAQAKAAGATFAAEKILFDRVIVSGLPRTVETATLVLEQTGQKIDLEHWPDLEELRGGKLSPSPMKICAMPSSARLRVWSRTTSNFWAAKPSAS